MAMRFALSAGMDRNAAPASFHRLRICRDRARSDIRRPRCPLRAKRSAINAGRRRLERVLSRIERADVAIFGEMDGLACGGFAADAADRDGGSDAGRAARDGRKNISRRGREGKALRSGEACLQETSVPQNTRVHHSVALSPNRQQNVRAADLWRAGNTSSMAGQIDEAKSDETRDMNC